VPFFWPVSASVQAVHAPVQAVSQQTLSGEQLPEPHWFWLSQASPTIFLILQVPLAQKLPVGQSVSPEHGLAQPVMTQATAPQAMVIPVTQVPLPSQVLAAVNFPSVEQAAGAQTCSGPCLRQAPAPSQVPSWPHLAVALWSVQTPRGSIPPTTGPQLPLSSVVNAAAQARQAPSHLSAQQTSSRQNPEAQSVSVLHGFPLSALPGGTTTTPSPGTSVGPSTSPPLG
jgi:hypothetical protein